MTIEEAKIWIKEELSHSLSNEPWRTALEMAYTALDSWTSEDKDDQHAKPEPQTPTAPQLAPYYIFLEDRIETLMDAIKFCDEPMKGLRHRVIWSREVQLLTDVIRRLDEEKERVYARL